MVRNTTKVKILCSLGKVCLKIEHIFNSLSTFFLQKSLGVIKGDPALSAAFAEELRKAVKEDKE